MRFRHFLPLSCIVTVAAIAAMYAESGASQDEQRQDAKSTETSDLVDEASRAMGVQDWERAAELLEQLVMQFPDNPQYAMQRGYALHASGRLQEAIEAHKHAAKFQAYRSTALYNLACAYSLLDKTDDAFSALDEAIAAGFANPNGLESDTDFNNIRSDARFDERLERLRKLTTVYREFDFWVGDWNVLNSAGRQIGTNRIERAENGFVIMEFWQSTKGGTGRSMNYVDPISLQWKQLWVDAGGGVVEYEGEFRDGAMHFKGSSTPQGGPVEVAKSFFKPLSDGRVHQYIEHSKDDGQSWYVYFDGYYVRKDESITESDSN